MEDNNQTFSLADNYVLTDNGFITIDISTGISQEYISYLLRERDSDILKD